MEIINKAQISESIKNGDYYKQAIEWYNRIFIFPVLEKSLFIIQICILSSASIGVLFNSISILPLSKQLRYSIELNDATAMNASVTKVDDSSMSVFQSVAKILITDYVMARENYNYSKLVQQYDYVYNSSTEEIYNQFKNYMGLKNPDSPILKYQKNSTRTTNVSSIDFFDNSAIIYYSAQVLDDRQLILNNSNWKVTMKFYMDNPDVYTTGRFNFVITDYAQELIKDLNQH